MIRKSHVIIILSIIVFLSACGRSQEELEIISEVKISSTQSVVPVKKTTATERITSTSIPNTQTSTMTVTPQPTLIEQGPYILYDKYGGYGPITILN